MNESAESEFGLGPIGQIAVPVEDVERAIAFYWDVLGMRFLFQAPPGLGFFDCGGVRLMLDGPAKAHAGQSSVVYYIRWTISTPHSSVCPSVASRSWPSRTSSPSCRITSCG